MKGQKKANTPVKMNPNSVTKAKKTKEFQKLIRKRKAAIEDLDFDTAQKIDEEIRQKNQNINDTENNTNLDDLKREIEEIVDGSNAEIEQAKQTKRQEELVMRKQINATFEELQKTHLQEINNFDHMYSIKCLEETERQIPEHDRLEDAAKKAALCGNYEDAKLLQKQALIAAQNELDKRMAKIDDDHEKAAFTLISQKRVEINHLVKRFTSSLQQLEERLEKQLKSIESRRDFRIIYLLQGYQTRAKNDPEMILDVRKTIVSVLQAKNCPIPETFFTR